MKARLFYAGILSVSFIFSPLSFGKRPSSHSRVETRRLQEGRSNKLPPFDMAKLVKLEVADNSRSLTKAEAKSVADAFTKNGLLKEGEVAEFVRLIRSSEEVGNSAKSLSKQVGLLTQIPELKLNTEIVLDFYRAMQGIEPTIVNKNNPQVANILNGLLSNTSGMLGWDSGSRQGALNLIKAFSAFKMGKTVTAVNSKGEKVTINSGQIRYSVRKAYFNALTVIEGIHKVAELRERAQEMAEKCRPI